MKDIQNSQNSSAQAPTTVNQNVPQAKPTSADGKQSTESNDKREELTNYEISSKTITTVSAGYRIEHLSVAVVINRAALQASLGAKADAGALDRKLADIEQLVADAAGAQKGRGDSVKVMAVDFVGGGKEMEPVASVGIAEALLRQSSTLINAAMVLVVTLVVVLLGIRPLVRTLSANGSSSTALASSEIILPELPELPAGALEGFGSEPQLTADAWQGEPSLIEDLTSAPRRSPQKRLEQMIEFDEEQAAAVLKQWIRAEAVPA